MGYVFDFYDALDYERWLNLPQTRLAIDLEMRMMLNLLEPMRGESVLDIGCGTGDSLLPFLQKGMQGTGIEPSPYMLDIAVKKLGERVELYRGFAEDLPFDDNAFNYASLVSTLEFVENPSKAIEEACRVAKNKVYIGVTNRYAIKCLKLRVKGMFTSTIYNHATFFSIWKLKRMVRNLLGEVPISWRTVCHFSSAPGNVFRIIENSGVVQRCPFGAHAGMVITLVPRFRTRPLIMPCHSRETFSALW